MLGPSGKTLAPSSGAEWSGDKTINTEPARRIEPQNTQRLRIIQLEVPTSTQKSIVIDDRAALNSFTVGFDSEIWAMVDAQPTTSSREFNRLFWGRQERNFDLRCDFLFDAEVGEVHTTYSPPIEYEGAPGKVHGGIIAAIMDEGQGALCYHLGHFVMTDQLCMSYKKAVDVERPVTIRCWITAVRRKKLYSNAEITNENGELLCSSNARWYLMPVRALQRVGGPDGYSETEMEKISAIMQANRQRSKGIRLGLKRNSVGES